MYSIFLLVSPRLYLKAGSMAKSSYKEDIKIDQYNLDIEWTKQASIYQKYCRLLAEAIYDRDKKKSEIEIAKSKLELRIRKVPQKFKLDKVTDNAILSCLNSNELIIEKQNELMELNYHISRLTGIKSSFEHKKTALEYVTKLYLAGYFADRRPAVEEDYQREMHVDNSLKKKKKKKKRKEDD